MSIGLADFWYYLAGTATTATGGNWYRVRAGPNGIVPPPMILHQAIYADDVDKLYVWHGMYEKFNLVNDPTTVMWVYSWCAPIYHLIGILPTAAHIL